MAVPLESSVVRIYSKSGKVIGAGFLVSSKYVLTCAHVVTDALGIARNTQEQPDGVINFDFPLLAAKQLLAAKVIFWRPVNPNEAFEDIAGLELETALPDTAQPAQLVTSEDLWGHPFRVLGFPAGQPNGVSASGVLRGRIANGWVQLEDVKQPGYRLEPGFSGAPVWDEELQGVAGMAVAAEMNRADVKAAFIIPTNLLVKAWSELGAAPRISRQKYSDRQALLDKVRNYWVKNFLEKSLHGRAMIELGLEERLDAVDHPWGMMWETPDALKQTLLPGTRVIHKFDELGEGRTLLILGEPGSGKTTTLLELARDLIGNAERDVTRPIPVVFNLSTWRSDQKFKTFADWLVQELERGYRVSEKLAKIWVNDQQLLLLLDGLDEVRADCRLSCLQGLNQLIQKYGRTEIVVCSRIKDYEALSEKLKCQGAIYLQPLTLEQINRYLTNAGAELAAVKRVLQTDATMQELATTPLMLNIMTFAYQGMSVEELPRMNSIEELRKHLFNAYIQRMFERRRTRSRKTSKHQYSKELSLHWLIWLAQRMYQEGQTLFLIERMQPVLLKNNLQKWIYSLAFPQLYYLIFSIYFTVLGVSTLLTQGSLWIYDGILIHPFWYLYWLFIIGIGIFIGINFTKGKHSINLKIVQKTKFLKWSLKRSKTGFMTGIIIALIVSGFAGGSIFAVTPPILIPILIIVWLIVVLCLGVIIGLPLALVAGLLSFGIEIGVERRMSPKQWFWQSVVNSGLFALVIGGTILGCFAALGTITGLGVEASLKDGAVAMSLFTPFVAILPLSGCIQHFTLRVVLHYSGYIPWNYARFLDYATERLFLQKVGGGYIFIHRLLQEHFAQLQPDRELQRIAQQEHPWKYVNNLSDRIGLVGSVAISSDGQLLASGSFDKTIRIWHLDTGELLRTLTGHRDRVISVAISPDGQFLASGSFDKTIKLWNLGTGELLRTLTGHRDGGNIVAISPDGQTLVSGSFDKTIKLWNLHSGELLHTFTKHSDGVHCIAISSDGQTLVSGDEKGQIRLWNLPSREPLHTLSGTSRKTLPRRLGDLFCRFLSRLCGYPVTAYPFTKFSGAVYSVAISQDGQLLASGGADKTIKLWHLGTGKLLRTLTGHSALVPSIAISSDGQTLVSGSFDKTIKIWNLGTGELLHTFTRHSLYVTSVALSLDGQTLVRGSCDQTIKIWHRIPD